MAQLQYCAEIYEITAGVNLRKPLQLLGLLCLYTCVQRHRTQRLENSVDVITARMAQPNMQSAIDYFARIALIADVRKNTIFAFASN